MARTGRPRKYDRAQVVAAVRQTRGNATAAARLLGCDRVTVWRYLQRAPGRLRVVDGTPPSGGAVEQAREWIRQVNANKKRGE